MKVNYKSVHDDRFDVERFETTWTSHWENRVTGKSGTRTHRGYVFEPRLGKQWEYPWGKRFLYIEATTIWEEDLYLATWNDLAIWIDGGKGISVFQVALVQNANIYLLRDFLNTIEEVQAWLDRAERIVQRFMRQEQPNNLKDIMGKWPGDETDEEVEKALEDL